MPRSCCLTCQACTRRKVIAAQGAPPGARKRVAAAPPPPPPLHRVRGRCGRQVVEPAATPSRTATLGQHRRQVLTCAPPFTPARPAGAVDIQELRLAGGSTPGEGRVEARVNGTWGTLCAPSYLRANDDILTAVCSQLGYSSTTHALARSGRRALYADSKLQSVANLLECPPGAGSLRGCKVSAAGGDTCGAGELELYSALSVACNGAGAYWQAWAACCSACLPAGLPPTSTSTCAPTHPTTASAGSSVPAAVRLVDGRTTTQGRVEVQLAPGGPWGAVCGDPLENTANVVCRQLGFHASSYQEASLDVGAPTNTSSPLVADVLCARNESSLTECSFGAPDPMYCSSAAGGLTVACECAGGSRLPPLHCLASPASMGAQASGAA